MKLQPRIIVDEYFEDIGQYRANEVVRWRVDFLLDAIANIEGLLAVNRDILQAADGEKATAGVLLNCAVLP